MQFDNTYFNKLNDFYAECDADIPPNPELIKFNKDTGQIYIFCIDP